MTSRPIVPRAAQASVVARSLAAAGYEVNETPDAWIAADPWGTPVRIVASSLRG